MEWEGEHDIRVGCTRSHDRVRIETSRGSTATNTTARCTRSYDRVRIETMVSRSKAPRVLWLHPVVRPGED